MAKGFAQVIVILKAILTRIIFAAHGLIAIWRVTEIKQDPYYWYLTFSILCLTFEGIFTLTIKKNQEWKWFCPSVFFYLCSVVPAIWLLEVDKFDKKALKLSELQNQTAIRIPAEVFTALDNLNLGVELDILKSVDEETWATIIEQLLMLILIIGRWMLPKGGLTRDQLSQLLLVYIGTAADIIEFFDSFKDDKIAAQRILCLLILSIWSWSLLQFTFVLTATKSRRTRITADIDPPKPKFVNGIYKVKEVCCSIDVWGILINIILQDAPFLIFRMLLITYYKIITYMNIFFTSKNTLVIILQFYRLYVVQQEKNKEISKMAKLTVSGNLAKAVERAAFMGPTSDPKIKSGRNANSRNVAAVAAAAKKAGNSKKGQKSNHQPVRGNGPPQPKKTRSQDSITSQAPTTNKILEAARRERAKVWTGRRKSLSTSNLPAEVQLQQETFTGNPEDRVEEVDEDDLEMGISGSVLSGTNDGDSQDVESDVPLDEISFTSEMPVTRNNKRTRMSENPGIYKISGSRSSETSSQQGHGRCRQDTGYSSSSRDSGNSNRRGRILNGGSRTGRAAAGGGGGGGRNRARNAEQRRRQMIIARELDSAGYGFRGETLEKMSSTTSSEALENERIFQRRAAICAVFSLFITIFILCMLAIYGGINPQGLVLRETFRVANSTKPKTTTTIAPFTNGTNRTETPVMSSTLGMNTSLPTVPTPYLPKIITTDIDIDNSTSNPSIDTMQINNSNNSDSLGVDLEGLSFQNDSSHSEHESDELSLIDRSNSLLNTSITNNNIPLQNSSSDSETSIEMHDKSSKFAEVEIKARNNLEQDFPGEKESTKSESLAFTPSTNKKELDFVRHSKRKVKRLYGFFIREFMSPLRRQ